MVKNLPAMQETWVRSLGQGRSPGERNGCPLQHSCLENSMDRAAWWATVCDPHVCKELDMTEQLTLHFILYNHFIREFVLTGQETLTLENYKMLI